MHLATLLTCLPILAAAVPTAPFMVQGGQAGQAVLAASGGRPGSAAASALGGFTVDIDLDDLRLVQFAEDEPPVWITELEKIEAKAAGRRFMDITETRTLGVSSFLAPAHANAKYKYPKPGKHAAEIKDITKTLSVEHMKKFLTKFTGFRTRYYRSDTGRESQKFLLATLKEAARGTDIDITEFVHSWGQNSIIARFPGKDDTAPITIVGAHQDSTNMWPFLPAPGADDDGSGTTSSLEAFRALVHANFTPPTPVEFHYFSAEEGGLLGSQAVAKAYEEKGVKVRAMLQMDMTAWVKAGTVESVGVIQDFVDPALTDFVEACVTEYLSIPPVKTQCGYSCSDHASFTKAGYQSAFAIESTFEDSNKNIHSTQDTIDHPEFSFTHMREFSKLAVAFAVELSASEK